MTTQKIKADTQIEGTLGGTIIVMDADTTPTVSDVDTIIFSGFLVEDLGNGDVRVTHSGGGTGFNDSEGDPTKVAGTAADGTSTFAARRDHVHDGGWILIQSIELGSDTPSLDFTSIPGTYKALKIITVKLPSYSSINSDIGS